MGLGMGGDIPFPRSGSVVSYPPAGSGAEPWPKLNFVQSECQRIRLVSRIALNFHSNQRL